MGICNGFQVCCEAGLLPGALLDNVGRRFVCRQVGLDLAGPQTAFTSDLAADAHLSIPVKHTTGRYYAPPEMLARCAMAARWCSATRRARTPTAHSTTSPAWSTSAATCSA